MPSISNCKVTYDFDDTVQYFKENNWSMIPMLSFDTTKTTVTSKDIDDYGDFVEWFVSRYKLDANIKYIELTNDPNKYWKGTNTQLIELNNETYEKIKENNPSLNVCTV
jgi:endo-1,4-beta-mannosidase